VAALQFACWRPRYVTGAINHCLRW